MDQTLIFWIIVGMCVVSYLPRMLPLQLLSGRQLHPLITAWLKLVPSAVLPAILVPLVLVERGEGGGLHFNTLFLLTTLVCFPLAARFRSLSLPVVLGMTLVAAGRFFFPGLFL